ncbi:hypothetical protein ACHWQZ_G010327 [Mnemiopsis leidyi]
MSVEIGCQSAKDLSPGLAPSLQNIDVIGREPIQLTCPQCQQVIKSKVRHEVGVGTWFIAAAIAFVTGCLCCWIACVTNACKDVVHTCPSCKYVICRRVFILNMSAPPVYPADPSYPPQQTPYQPTYQPAPAAYPPAPGYDHAPAPAPPYHAGNTATVVIAAQPYYGSFPVTTLCTGCNQTVTTIVSHEVGSGSWLICLILFFLTGICCFLPFCITSMQDHVHKCPNCKRIMATKRLM